MSDELKEMLAFLEKETPTYGGCMVCKVKRDDKSPEILLIQRYKFANGDGFTINRRMFYDYDFIWRENPNWEILWKYNGE